MSKMTKTQLIAAIAEETDLAKKDVGAVLEALSGTVIEQLKSVGAVVIPGLLNLKLVDKPATVTRPGVNPFTGEKITIKAKPASKRVKALPIKALKDAIA